MKIKFSTYKTIYFFLMFLATNIAYSQEKKWAAGIRIGEPAGLTIRKYLNNDENVLELNIGTYGAIWNGQKKYFGGEFRTVGLTFSGLYLWHNDVSKINGLKTYYGFGAQVNSRDYFVFKETKLGKDVFDEFSSTSFGPCAIAGLEYFLNGDMPLSIFMELGGYAEFYPAFFFARPQGGVGLRYNL
ncbi:MAG: hypothetical protein KA313_08075 [Pseudarcicella sp.]|nr:hypothetical protein [Pseudarcicella sp.]